MKAIWKNTVLATSDDTVIVENNHYFPISSLHSEYFSPGMKQSSCPWKGKAKYYNITVDGEINPDAAWYYPDTKEAANNIRGRIAFWKGVQVSD